MRAGRQDQACAMATLTKRMGMLRWLMAALLVAHYSAASATSFGGTVPASRSAAGAGAGDAGLVPNALRWGERAGLQAVTGKFTARDSIEVVLDDVVPAPVALHEPGYSSLLTRARAVGLAAAACRAFDARAPPAIA
jgi:hypothetical protein